MAAPLGPPRGGNGYFRWASRQPLENIGKNIDFLTGFGNSGNTYSENRNEPVKKKNTYSAIGNASRRNRNDDPTF
jgi:hypothetical protein